MTTIDPAAFLDLLDEVCFIFADDLTLQAWNQAVESVTGHTDEELANMSVTALFEDDTDRVAEAFETLTETGSVTVETALATAEGRAIPYEFEFDKLDAATGENVFAGVGRDVSAKTVSEQRREEVASRMSDGFFAVDTEWRVTHVNDRGRTILSEAIGEPMSQDELLGTHLWEAIPEAVGTVFYEKYHEAVESQEPVVFVADYEPLDIWFDVRAYPSETGLSVYFYDITERHRQREAVERRERVLREMHDIIADRNRPFAEQVKDLLALGRKELNTAFGSLSRIEGHEYVFKHVDADTDAIEPGDVVPLSATNCEIAAQNQRTVVLGDIKRDAPEETHRAGYTEWGISCYIGAPVFVDNEVYGTFCFYDTEPRDGQFDEWEVTLVDLMSRWVSYELQRQKTTAILQAKNEQLERFTSVVSHDLRNPLNVLEGRLELAEETGDPEEFERCRRAIRRMNTLIEDLLVLARTGSAVDDPAPVALGDLVADAWESVQAPSATLHIETERSLMADRHRLTQLVENLIRNAIEHGGETVTVTVGDVDVGFYFADDGPGIPTDEREQIFESGYSTNAEGTGFGLSIIREIATAHGWDVAVGESERGGARFEITGVDWVE